MWQDVLDGVREITAGKGKSYIVRVRCTTQLYSDPYSYSSRTGPLHHHTVSWPLDRVIRL